jgi:glycosyltransferase involved in cell wall biosynthesis
MKEPMGPPVPSKTLPSSYSTHRILRFRLRQALDWFFQVRLRRPLTWLLVCMGLIFRRVGARRRGLDLLMRGRRVSRNAIADAALRKILETDPEVEDDLVALFGPSVDKALSRCAGRILILKVPRVVGDEVVEKGAIIFKFTETFAPIYQQTDTQRLAKYFRIILEPSWVGYSLPEILIWTRLAPEKVIVMAPYQPDYELLEALESNLVPVSLGPADWGNPDRFQQLDGVDKIYDSIYVANYNPKKRVDRFLRAVVKIARRREGYRAALICAGVGRDEYGLAIRDTVAWAKTRANIDFFDSVKQFQLNQLFNQSRVNVLLSLREGMNKGLAEGLHAGTPALLIAESACGNHRHINAETGRVIPDRVLERALGSFAEGAGGLRPSEWAQAHITPQVSTKLLSETLHDMELQEGREWTSNLIAKANQPEMRYVSFPVKATVHK